VFVSICSLYKILIVLYIAPLMPDILGHEVVQITGVSHLLSVTNELLVLIPER
jgi:hypothetical protein